MLKCSEMPYHIALELRIYPSSMQKRMVAVNDGVSRAVYNRLNGTDRELHSLRKVKVYSEPVASRITYLETVRSSRKELVNTMPFLSDRNVDMQAVDNAMANYRRAWKQFREVPGTGMPAFHKKSYEQRYQTNAHYKKGDTCWDDGTVRFVWRSANEQVPHHILLPCLGVVRFGGSEEMVKRLLSHREDTRIGTITVRRDSCGEYHVSLQASSTEPFAAPFPKTGSSLGVDMNLSNLYTDSNGNAVPSPREGRKAARRLAKDQRRLSRMAARAKKEGRALETSKNYQKQRLRTAKVQRHISLAREEDLQALTKRLVESQDLVVTEDLKVKNLMGNHRLAYSIADVSWGKFFTLLGQKAAMYGKVYIRVPASNTTQTCSSCGHVMKGEDKVPLGVEEWDCPACGAHHNRDHNSAKVILARGLAAMACM